MLRLDIEQVENGYILRTNATESGCKGKEYVANDLDDLCDLIDIISNEVKVNANV